jgi:hypothetical protein
VQLISYVQRDCLASTQATDVSVFEFYMYLLRHYGNGVAVTLVHDMSPDDFKRWQVMGGSVLYKRDLNAS